MLKMKYNLFLFIFMILNPFIVMSMNSILGIWMNMEFNLILFLTYVIMNNKYMYDLSMKYFLMNSFSSSIFFFFMIMYYMNMMNLFNYMMNFIMLIKLGIPPFHYWFINLMKNFNWISCLLLSTWQKFIPMIILFYIMKYSIIILFILFGSLISIIKGFISMNLKEILGYSSINHLSWMLTSMIYNLNLWMIYFFSYLFMMFSLINLLNNMNLNFINDFTKMNLFSYKKLILFMFMSLGSLPPMFGFLMKWFFIYKLVFYFNYLFLLMLILFSLIFLYYYMRLMFNFFFMFNFMIKFYMILMFNKLNFLNLFFYIISIFNLFMLLIYLN